MNEVCQEKKINGICPKGDDCLICGKEIQLNVNAKGYVPKKKIPNEKLQFNIKASEYVPKSNIEPKQEDINQEEEEEQEVQEDMDDENEEEFDMIMKDAVENDVLNELADDDDSDEDNWYPKYKDCNCCQGFVYKCKGTSCESLGQCFCKMKDDCEYDFEDK